MFCRSPPHDWEEYPGPGLAALYAWRWDGRNRAAEAKAPLRGACLDRADLASVRPLVRQEIAAWAAGTAMTRGVILHARLPRFRRKGRHAA